ncbi:STAS domain-containing protein [Actinomycetes bacterium KLBMP 9797]
MTQFEARTSADPGHAVVSLAGECDLSVRESLTSVLLDAVHRAQVVTVDLAGVTFMDSSGLHALMTAHHAAQRTGRRLYVRGATGGVAALLDLTGLRTVLTRPATDTSAAASTPLPAAADPVLTVDDSGHD